MRRRLAVLLPLLAATGACSDFPCITDSATRPLPTVAVNYDDQVRYTYWFEDGAQRQAFDREAIPETARAAVLVHVGTRTEGGLHGATGWAADVSGEAGATAEYVPMAAARTRAYAAWAGDWSGVWVSSNAAVWADALVRKQEMEASLSGNAPAPGQPSVVDQVPGLSEELSDEGITLDGLKMGRALRAIAARQPLPRDFGLSVAVHGTWLFVDPECAACDAAEQWLEQHAITHHTMVISDPTNARTLRDLSRRAGFEMAGVPSVWRNGKLTRGFDAEAWGKEQP